MELLMKILHVYAGNLFGGIETLLVTLAKQKSYLDLSTSMQHHFALCFEGRLAAELQNFSVSVHMLGEVRVSRFWTVLKARAKLKQLLRSEQFDAVICHACWSQAVFGTVVRSNNLPLIFWCHDAPSGAHWLEKWSKLTLPDLVIANSLYTQAAATRLYPQIHSDVLYLPVEYTEISIDKLASVRTKLRDELKAPLNTTVIIQACRLEKWKGQTALLSALGKLRDVPDWICWIVGGVQRSHEASYLQELKGQASELGISDRVLFLGQRSDVPHLLAAANIHCQPNILPEPFGIAFIEALYAGLPVVTTAIGGALEIVDESCGFLVAPNDIEALSEVLGSLINNPNERSTLASKGVERASQLCEPARQLHRLQNLLFQLVREEIIV
jgi:glycosyltransferase involved in cell wall biosynthesis